MHFVIRTIYDSFPILVCLDESDKKLYSILKDNKVPKKERSIVSLKDADGIFYMFSNYKCIIRLPWIPKTSYELGVLVHEVNHCTFQILRSAGVKFGRKSEEAYTYLSQYIFQQILCQIN